MTEHPVKDYLDTLEGLSRKQLMVLLARQRHAATEGVAVVGMALRYPGGLEDPARLWAALRGGRVVAGDEPRIPVDSFGRPRWNVEAPDLAPYADLLGRGAYLSDIDVFDAERFGIGAAEATYLDPQQRLLASCAAEALADADVEDGPSLRTGIFAAMSTVEYNYAALRNCVKADELSAHLGPGSALSAAAGRIATALRLRGPALTVDTACSSALTALHLACASLRGGECEVAIVAASHLLLAPGTFGVFARAGMLSPTGRSRPFDARADGYQRGEGCGVLVLRRLRDAPRPYAVVRGTAIHQHGDRGAIARVSARAQAQVIQDALRAARVEPDAVGYVEAQANGIRLADVVEAEVLGEVYGRCRPACRPLPVGSAKANLGYLETVSGMASLMKTVLVLATGELPPQVGVECPDPDIAWERARLAIVREPTRWPADAPRLAGVSSFGFTGTYAHAVLAAADDIRPLPEPAAEAVARPGRGYWPESHRWS